MKRVFQGQDAVKEYGDIDGRGNDNAPKVKSKETKNDNDSG